MPTFGPVKIASNTRDGQEQDDSFWLASGHDSDGNKVGTQGASAYDMGMSWVTTIPQGATITSATVRVFMKWRQSGSSIVTRLQGLDVDNVAPFSSTNRPSQNAQTTAFVDRTLTSADWNTNAYLQLDDITAIIQEIVDRPGFGGNIGVVLKDNGSAARWQLQDYGRQPTNAAELTVVYSTVGAGDTLINATEASRILFTRFADIFAGVDTEITSTLVTRTITPLNAVITTGVDTEIVAGFATLSTIPLDASIIAQQDTVINTSVSIKTINTFNAVIAALTDTVIAATRQLKTLSTNIAAISLGSDVVIAATTASRTLTPLNALIFAGVVTSIAATVVTKNVTTLNSAVSITTDVDIAATKVEKVLTPFSAIVFSGIDTEVNATSATRTLIPLNGSIVTSTDVNILATKIDKIIVPNVASVFAGVDTHLAALTEIKTLTPFSANVVLSADTVIVATSAQKILSSFNSSVFSGIDTNIQAIAVVTKTLNALNGIITTSLDTNVLALSVSKTLTPFPAVVTGVGGALITASTSIKTLQPYDAVVFPGLRIYADIVQKNINTFNAAVYDGNLKATIASKNIVVSKALFRFNVAIPATTASRNIVNQTAVIKVDSTLYASAATRSVLALNAVVASGTTQEFIAGFAQRAFKTLNAQILGVQQILDCNLDLNLTIPHAEYDADEQQRVLIENFINLQECYDWLKAYMLKCCAAKGFPTNINAFTSNKQLVVRNASIGQVLSSCLYEDFVANRKGSLPGTWFKLNDLGTPASIPSNGSENWQTFAVNYSVFGLSNNLVFGEPPVITQQGTTSLGFSPEYLEGDTFLTAASLYGDWIPVLDFEVEFWARLGNSGVSVELSGTMAVSWFGDKVFVVMESTDSGEVTVSSQNSYNVGDVVHVVVQLRAGGFTNGALQLFVNGVDQGIGYLDGDMYIEYDPSPAYIEDVKLEVYGGYSTGAPTYIDQITFANDDSWPLFMTPAQILETYNCGIGA